jgi:CRISPR-associated DxTHG motif protein
MKAISFLGIREYKHTCYTWQGNEFSTHLFPEAFVHFVQPDKLYICLTPTAKDGNKSTNWQELRQRFDDQGVNYEVLTIPEGHSEEELWQIFQKLTDAVEENEELYFDITHSFRSLPFLSFLAIAYLKAAKNVQVKGVLYGAHEARDDNNQSPVFDLTAFVQLLDWLTAVNQFTATGNAEYLAKQLQTHHSDDLSQLAENVSQISLGLELLRPHHVAQAAYMLPTLLKGVKDQLPPPFLLVAQPLNSAYAQFGISQNPSPQEHLRVQLRMINWYFEKRRYVQALSMAREWVVSFLCFEFGLDIWEKTYREEMELLLSGGTIKENDQVIKESPYLSKWKQYPYSKLLKRLWTDKSSGLANLRNDVLHSGFRKAPLPIDEIINRTQVIVDHINEISNLKGLS